jgi:hypothetical protein
MALLLMAPLPIADGYTASMVSKQEADTVYIHTVDGYTASMVSKQEADTVYIHINAYHSTDEMYNACEIELTYDAEMLRFDSERSTLGNSAYRDTNGQLMLVDFGADKPLGESVYVLAFEVIGAGEAEIQLYRAAFITSEKAVSEDIEPIVNEPDSITVWVR